MRYPAVLIGFGEQETHQQHDITGSFSVPDTDGQAEVPTCQGSAVLDDETDRIKCAELVEQLNQSLEQCGFATLQLGTEENELSCITTSFISILEQYNRKDELARQLLRENESWMHKQESIEDQLGYVAHNIECHPAPPCL